MKAPRISQEELKEKLDSAVNLTLLDVRNPADYAASSKKIPGAARVPLDELEAVIGRGDLDKSVEVVAYCT